jgi:hypothetical protein
MNPPQRCSHTDREPTVLTVTLSSRVGGTQQSERSMCDSCLAGFIARLQMAVRVREEKETQDRWLPKPRGYNLGAPRRAMSGY